MDSLKAVNDAIQQAFPALYRCLSPLGLRVVYPPDIPFQAAQAKGKRYNATIGQITTGSGRILSLPSLERALEGLDEDDRNAALLYSPMEGILELRQRWRKWQRSGCPNADTPSSLPLVTAGLTQGLALVADLFAAPGRQVVVPAPAWGNYRQIFAVRTGASILAPPAYKDGRYNPTAVAEALSELPRGEPALAILNLPSNPGGYSPTTDERQSLVESLLESAEGRPLVVVCDDAYSGLVYEDGVPRESVFWHLVGRHPNLFPIKIDGSTKEFVLFGGRVGFLSFPFPPTNEATLALESKAKCLVRATVGSPVALSQTVLLQAMRREEIEAEVATTWRILKARYDALKAALMRCDHERLRPLPFNSGAFALLELPHGLEPERLRRHLLEEEDTGVVAVQPRYVRIAFCSVEEPDLAQLVQRIERGIGRLVARD